MLNQLQTFLIDESLNLEKLDSFLKEPNYLEILGVSHKELQHSNFLAWFLDWNGSHKIGNYFLKSFINLLEITPEEKIRMNLSNLSNTIVKREYKNIDILIVNRDLNFTICIENKIYAGKSGANQLVEYYNVVENIWHSNKQHKNYYVYLTPFPRDLTEKENEIGYINITYREILEIIEDTIQSRNISESTKPLVLNYIQNFKKNIMKESNEIALAQEIYRKHKAAIDFIINNKPNLTSLFKKINQFLLNHDKYENLTPDDNGFIRFLPKEVVGAFDYDKSWGNSNKRTAFALEIICEYESIWVKFCFGHLWGENKEEKQNKKDASFTTMKKFDSLKGLTTKSKSSSKWVAVARYTIMTTSNEEIYEYDNLFSAFLDKFKLFEDKLLNQWTSEVKEKITKA